MTLHRLTLTTGAELCVHDEGAGPLMVLISGLGGTATFWQAQRREFSQSHRVISFDQPGCGEAPAFPGPVSVESLAGMVAELLAHLAPGEAPAVLCGHSTGGAIAQAYVSASLGPAPERLVLSGSWMRACAYMQSLFAFRIRSLGEDMQGDLSAYASMTWLLGVSPGDVTEPRLPAAPLHDPVRAGTQVARMRALLAFDGLAAAGGIGLPSLICGARDDRIVPPYHQEQLAATIPGARLHMLDDGGHFYPQSRSAPFNEILKTWLTAA